MVQDLSPLLTFRLNNMAEDSPFSRSWKKKADHLWSLIVKQSGRCAYCGSVTNLQAHHLIPRGNSLTRHKIECGICLCEYHHLYCSKISPHLVPKDFEKWIKKNLPEKYRWVQKNRHLRNGTKIDFQAAYEKLKLSYSCFEKY
jgi:hypothetical protein